MPLVGAGLVGSGSAAKIELDSLEGIAWELNGNVDTDPNIDFLGTVDNKPLVIRTNNIEKLRITEDGRIGIGESDPQSHVHIKSHTGYPGSGLRIDTFVMSSDDLNYNTIYSFTIPNFSTALITITFVGREDINERCGFKRTITIYRQGGIAQVIQPKWQSDYTMKSNKDFNVDYNIVMDTIHFRVKNANALETHWTGHIEIELIS